MSNETSKHKFVALLSIVVAFVIGVLVGGVIAGSSSDGSKASNDSSGSTLSSQYVNDNRIHENGTDPQCYLAEIADHANKVYLGQLSVSDFDGVRGNGVQQGELPDNLGFPTGQVGLHEYLADTTNILRGPGTDGDLWSPASNVIIKNLTVDPAQQYTYLNSGGIGLDYDGNANDDISSQTRELLAALIDVSAPTPADLVEGLPSGSCQYPDTAVDVVEAGPTTGYDQNGDGVLDDLDGDGKPDAADVEQVVGHPVDGDCGVIAKDFPTGDVARARVIIESGTSGCTIARRLINGVLSPSAGFSGDYAGWVCEAKGNSVYNEVCTRPSEGGLATIKSVGAHWQ